ncbi:MAG: glycosyl hydrolase [Flammeovirgaceae bacterium]|nr:glycosyl hydrolase [Flammeovirgaceae bacterium]
MRTTLFSLAVLLICSNNLSAQKKKKITTPGSTTAEMRWAGFQQRQQLLNNSLVKNIPFRNIGPTIMSGRVVDLEVDPNDPTHFFVAYASGGLWETKNEGTSFTPLFDNEIVMTIGDIDVDWNTGAIYIGSGENNSSRSSYSGYGLFKSDDNGESWQHLGLEETHHIGRVIVHPTNSDIIWVASLGHLYSDNPERGVYKTTDGGKTWKKTLYVNDQSGIIDMVINPKNPEELLAAAWQKDRKAWNFVESGPGSGIYKSTDGGETWTNISEGDSGFPDTDGMGRVGLAYAPSNPNIIYAMLDNQDRRDSEEEETYPVTRDLLRNTTMDAFLALTDNDINDFLDRERFPREINAVDLKKDVESGKVKPADLVIYLEDANSMLFDTPVKGAEVYKSTDGGKSWAKTHEDYIEALVYSYGYYFGQIRVDGQNPDIIYTVGVPLVKSMDGGKTWEATSSQNVHADHHALWVNPNRPGHLINGNDGGVNISYDNGETWIKCNSTQVGQFYSINYDMAEPYNVYGGLQDNGVWKGPSNYEYSYSWYEEGKYPYERLMGGDGMQVAIDTRTNNLIYTGYQFGNYFRIDMASGDRKYITPTHELGDAPYRWNWEAPIMLSSHNQDIVYFGSNKFHRSMNQGSEFETLSGDLTNGGKKGDVSYGTLTTISESPLRFGLIYTGSDDGLIHVSKDVGQTWMNISSGLPKDFWVSQVQASNHVEGRVYASLNGYRWDNFEAMVYVSNDYGKTWTSISNNLPKEPVNVVKEDPKNENIIYVGTDHGAYVSLDKGKSYMAFAKDLPAVAIHDLVIHPRENDLILGSHGRSIFVADVSALQQLPETSDAVKIFSSEGATFSDRWGNVGYYWGGPYEPSTTFEVYTKSSGKGKISISMDDTILKEWEVKLDAGINYINYDFTIEESSSTSLKEQLELEEEIVAKENGSYYLQVGDYTVTVTMSNDEGKSKLSIKAPRERPKRKGSK